MCIRDSRGTDGRSAGDLMGNSVTRPCVDRKKPLTRSIIPQPPDDEPKTLPGILDDYGAPTERTVDVDHTDLSSGSGLARAVRNLSLIHISEPTRLLSISYAVFCLKKKKKTNNKYHKSTK
eukprot:TRINITY_DN7634_c0_g1_i12.p1 TRINITY_DN7634_c0_g1~~TRINITY_DN7634_c0_g1_i12.p1  ORF type:complete len:121 (+),score=22.48 TRINITY_DN7634_c0_g1_i12:200-562(+)